MKTILAAVAVLGIVLVGEASANGGAFQRQVVVRRVVQQPVVVRQVVHQPVVVRQQVHAVNQGCFGSAVGACGNSLGYGGVSVGNCGNTFGVGNCGNAFSAGYGVNQFGFGGGYGNAFGFQRQRFIGNRLVSPFGLNRGFGFGRGLSLNFGF